MGKRRNDQPYQTTMKCPKHNAWRRKGVCELCLMEADKQKLENEKTGGSNHPPVKIGTTDKIGKN